MATWRGRCSTCRVRGQMSIQTLGGKEFCNQECVSEYQWGRDPILDENGDPMVMPTLSKREKRMARNAKPSMPTGPVTAGLAMTKQEKRRQRRLARKAAANGGDSGESPQPRVQPPDPTKYSPTDGAQCADCEAVTSVAAGYPKTCAKCGSENFADRVALFVVPGVKTPADIPARAVLLNLQTALRNKDGNRVKEMLSRVLEMEL